ncbi:MAG: putative sulfate exporter family transporter [Pseudomonadota bacterium]
MSDINAAKQSLSQVPSLRWRLQARIAEFLPGVLLATIIAMAAMFLNERYGGPVMLYALLLGIAFSFLHDHERLAPGICFAAQQVLRIGIMLLGIRITIGEVALLGLPTLALVIAGLVMTIGVGTLIARSCGLKPDHAVLSAGAVAICGASAALAISAVLPQQKNSERNTILTIVGVTALSTIAMVIYPFLAAAFDLTDREAGIFIGATIHDVAQVVGAGYTISDEAGETATIVKLMRVACLVPVIFLIGMSMRGGEERPAGAAPPPLLPLFLVGFVVLMILNSGGLVPEAVQLSLGDLSRWGLITAVAALGIRTSLSDIFKVGLIPVAVLTLQTVMLAAFALAGICLFIAV